MTTHYLANQARPRLGLDALAAWTGQSRRPQTQEPQVDDLPLFNLDPHPTSHIPQRKRRSRHARHLDQKPTPD